MHDPNFEDKLGAYVFFSVPVLFLILVYLDFFFF